MSKARTSQSMQTCWIMLLMLAGLSLAPDLFGQGQTLDRAVAIVDSRIITLSEVQEESRTRYMTNFFPNQTTGPLTTEAFAGDVDALNRLIDYRLLLQGARNVGLKVNEAEIVTQVEQMVEDDIRNFGGREAFLAQLEAAKMDLATMKKVFRRKSEERLLISRFVSSQVSVNREEVAAFREELEAAGAPTEIYTLSHLLLACPSTASAEQQAATLQRAEAVHRQLESGQPFAELASLLSEDAGTRANGGMLGALAPNDLDPAVLAEISSLKVGQFSKPVQTGAGYHIFFLSYKQTAREMLLSQRFQQKQAEQLQRLRDKATIEIISHHPATNRSWQ